MSRRWLCTILLLIAQTVSAQWSTNWPISHLTTVVPSGTYSNYMTDLYWATDERAKATAYQATNSVEYAFTGTGFIPVTNPVLTYYAPPFKWAPYVPWYIGVYTDTTVTASMRFDQRYTNGIPYTNKVYTLMTGSDSRTYTNLLYRAVIYTNGIWVTNTAYNITHTNILPRSQWITNDLAYNIFKKGNYPFTGYSGSEWDSYWVPPNMSYSVERVRTNIVLNAPSITDPPIWGHTYSQMVSAITGSIPYYLQTGIDTTTGRVTWKTNYANIVGSNYWFQAYTAVVARLPTYTTNVLVDTNVYAPDTLITYTNSFRVIPDDFGYDMSGLISNITAVLLAAAPHYGVTTNFVTDTLDTYLTTVKQWMWMPTLSTWTNVYAGQLVDPQNISFYWASPGLPKWTVIDWLQATNAGTNLYRKTMDVDVDNILYADKTGPAYIQHHGTFSKPNVDAAWKYGVYTVEKYTPTGLSAWTNTMDNPQFLTVSNQLVNIHLGTVTLTPQWETSVKVLGFTNIFWSATTSAPPYKIYAAVTTNDFVVTNLNWLLELNGRTFSRNTFTYPDSHYDAGTYTVPYYDGGSDLYIVPLVDGPTYFDYFGIDEFSWELYAFNAQVRASTWVVVHDLTYGKNLAVNWRSWFGTLANAELKLHQLGYPTKVDDTRVGYKSLGPSGYYYPGGVIQALTYSVGQISTVDRAVLKTATEDTSAYGAATAYPYIMDYMPWETLTNWPATVVDILPTKPSTTVIPSTTIAVTGNILRADSLLMPDGYYSYTGDTANVYVSTTNQQTTLPLISLSMPGNYPEDIINFYYFSLDWESLDSPMLPYRAPEAAADWSRTVVWNIKGTSVTDSYYTVNIGRVVTNYTQVVHGTVTTSVTNVYAWPVLQQTNTVVNIPDGLCAADTKISFRVVTNMSLYASYSGIINPSSLDARYRAINALKYAVFSPQVYTMYNQWTNGPTMPGNYFGLDKTIYKDVLTTNLVIPYSITNFDYNLPSYGANYIEGPVLGTNYVYPEWSVYPINWYVEGTGWKPVYDAVDDDNAALFQAHIELDFAPGVFEDHERVVTRDMLGLHGNYAINVYTGIWASLPIYSTLVGSTPMGRWAKDVGVILPVDTNLSTSIEIYTGISYTSGTFSATIPSVNSLTVLNAAYARIGTENITTNYNSVYIPPAIPFTTNAVKRYRTISGTFTSLAYTDVYDYATVPMQINIGTLLTTNGNLSADDDVALNTTHGEHAWTNSIKYFSPYSYKMQSIECTKQPAFQYHD